MLKRVPWSDVESELSACCPRLASLMANIAPLIGDDGVLYIIEYEYGDMIVSDGLFDIERWSHHEEYAALSDTVTYSPIPLSVVLKGSVEVFRPPDSRRMHSVPLAIQRAGEIYGVFETLNTLAPQSVSIPSRWSVSSGARSVHVLAALNEKSLWDKLKSSLGLNHESALFEGGRIAIDSWPLVKAIARNQAPTWRSRVLVIPSQWLTGSKVEFSILREFLFGLGWVQSSYLRESSELESELKDMQLRLDEFSPWGSLKADNLVHLKQIIAIAQGVAPGFKRARAGDTEFGPFGACEKFLTELRSSGSRNGRLYLGHHPVILRPGLLEGPSDFVYYSASRPSVLVPIVGKKHAWTDDFLRPFVKLLESRHLDRFLKEARSGPIELKLFGYKDPSRDKSPFHFDRKDIAEHILPEAAELTLPFHATNDFMLACVIVSRP